VREKEAILRLRVPSYKNVRDFRRYIEYGEGKSKNEEINNNDELWLRVLKMLAKSMLDKAELRRPMTHQSRLALYPLTRVTTLMHLDANAFKPSNTKLLYSTQFI
jgi:hypothetical protein